MSTHLRLRVGTCSVLILVAFSGTARAQAPAVSLHELGVLVGARVEVMHSGGSVFKGQLIEASETGLLLKRRGDGREVRLAASRIEEVSRRLGDSPWNGALIGAALGAAPLIILSAASHTSGGNAIYVSALFGGIGAGIGAAIDASLQRKKTVLFRGAAPPVAVAPMLTGGRKGVVVSARF
jgi:hypothetical protein